MVRRKLIDIDIVLEEGVELPSYIHGGDSGFDLIAHDFKFGLTGKSYPSEITTVTLEPHETFLIGTGIYMAISYGYELQVRSRSGNSFNKGYVVANSPGTVDSNYRGEIMVIILNTSDEPVIISKGDKIAQGVLAEVPIANWKLKTKLDDNTTRGSDGFGSTDKKKK